MKRLLIGAILLSMVFLYGFGEPVRTYEQGDKTLAKKVLIAMQRSTFKSAVLEKIIPQLIALPVHVKVVDLDALSKEPLEGFSVVIVFNTCKMGGLDKSAQEMTEKDMSTRAKVILVTTAGSEDWQPATDVDTITSASKMEKVDQVTDEIMLKVRAKLIQ